MAVRQEVHPAYLATAFSEMWYLFVLLAVMILLAVLAYFRQQAPAEGAGADAVAGGDAPAIALPQPPDRMVVPSDAEQASAIIAEHQAKLDADPRSEDAPGYLNAMGNLALTRQMDYRAAAQYYERLVADYPSFAGIGQVYIQLGTCYDRLGDQQHVRWAYKQMMERFPEDSKEYLFAKAQLGL